VARTTRLLYASAAMLLLLGLVLRVAPAPVGAAQVASPAREAPAAAHVAKPRVGSEAETPIVNGNIFSPDRSAPKVHYTPPDLARPPQPARPAKVRPVSSGLRLLGTVVGPSGTAALIDADPAIPGAESYGVGDRVGRRRIVAVSESTVVLDGTGGRLVLRLQPPQPTH
jgi:hypothetical protein